MKLNRYDMAIAALVVLCFAIGAYFYPMLPERMASHWNAQGQADGYDSRFWGTFLVPFISVGLAALLVFIPRLDPLKANVSKFQKYYYGFIVILMLYLLYLYLLTIIWNLGARFDFTRALIPAFAILFYAIGVMVAKSKRNWFIGIRTPWTLSNEKVWDRTHLIGGRLFKVAAVVTLLGFFFASYAIWFMLAPVLLVSLFTVIYSYYVYRQESKGTK